MVAVTQCQGWKGHDMGTHGLFHTYKGTYCWVPTGGWGPQWGFRPPSPAPQPPGKPPNLPWGNPSSALPHQPPSAAHAFSAQETLFRSHSSSSPGRVCPPSLAWCLQLLVSSQLMASRPPPQPRSASQGSPSQLWAIIRDGSPGLPILSPRMPSSGLAQPVACPSCTLRP